MLRYACALALIAGVAAPRSAGADDLGTRKGQRGVITKINKGVFQLGMDSTLILGYRSEDSESSYRANAIGNVILRYYIKDNLGLSARLGGLYRKAGETRDLGFVGTVWANYFMRLGEGLFFSPGAGVGFLAAQRDVPMAGGATVARSSVIGGVASMELPIMIFLGSRFSLTAGPEMLLTFGGTNPEMGDGTSFVSLDGGFKVGAAYAF